MSEFQCYQFRSFDRPLTESERKEVSSWSSRVEVSSNAATFIYHYGDFRKSPEKVVEQYFDAMLYFTNWGTRQLLFRLPEQLIDAKAIERFCVEHEWSSGYISLTKKGKVYLLDIHYSDEEGGEWMEDDDFDLGIIGQIREDILSGDFSALYLIWAQFSKPYEDDDDFIVKKGKKSSQPSYPEVPANLKKLSSALSAFIEFFYIEMDLVSAIQSVSQSSNIPEVNYEKLLIELTEKERIEWLLRLINGEPKLDFSLKKRLEKLLPAQDSPKATTTFTPAQLFAKTIEERKKREQKEAAASKAAFLKKMKKFEKQEDEMWESVGTDLARQTGKAYDQATATLKDLRDLAVHKGLLEVFDGKMRALKEEYAKRSSLIGRWKKAGLLAL